MICKTLLGGVDVGTEAGLKEARERNLFKTVCPDLVRDAEELLRDLTHESQEGRTELA